MPHAELKYSDDLTIDAAALLRAVEAVILRHDAGSGECKGRAYPASIYRHSHCVLKVLMLTKPHRDAAFSQALLKDLEDILTQHLSEPCFYALDIDYSGPFYVTKTFTP